MNLLNPLKTLPLLVKSFFPPGGDKDAGTKDSATPSKSLVSKYKSRKAKFGPTKYYIKGKEVTAEQAAPFVEAANEERIKGVSASASYEDETVVLPPIKIKEGDGEKTSAKALFITSGVLYAQKGGDDPYEKLYVGGLG